MLQPGGTTFSQDTTSAVGVGVAVAVSVGGTVLTGVGVLVEMIVNRRFSVRSIVPPFGTASSAMYRK